MDGRSGGDGGWFGFGRNVGIGCGATGQGYRRRATRAAEPGRRRGLAGIPWAVGSWGRSGLIGSEGGDSRKSAVRLEAGGVGKLASFQGGLGFDLWVRGRGRVLRVS